MAWSVKDLKTKEEKLAYLRGYNAGFRDMQERTEEIIELARDKAMEELLQTEQELKLS